MYSIYKNFRNNIFYYLIYFLFIIEIMLNIQSKYLAGDESFTYHIIHYHFLNIINLTSQDVHPFLYYFICKLFIYNIHNMYTQIFILRLISALPYLILLIIGNSYIKQIFSKKTSIIFMFCIISMPLLVDNMYTIRMYGWATLLTTIVYILFISAYKWNNNLITFFFISFFAILSAYTHYYALITVVLIYLMFLIFFIANKKNIKYLLLSIIINLIVYFPWMNILFIQSKNVSHSFWTTKLHLQSIIHIIIGSISPTYNPSILYILPLMFLIILSFVLFNKNIIINNINIFSVCVPLLLICIGSLLSIIFGHAVIMVRYVTPTMGIFWLSISIIISEISNNHRIIRYLLIIITILIGIMSYVNTNKNTLKFTNQYNKTLKIYRSIPNDSAIMYDDTEIMSGALSYINNNYTLDNSSKIYRKVFNNFSEYDNIRLPYGYKHIFYIRSDKQHNKLINKFNHKYITHYKKQIFFPIDSNLNNIYIYKIK